MILKVTDNSTVSNPSDSWSSCSHFFLVHVLDRTDSLFASFQLHIHIVFYRRV